MGKAAMKLFPLLFLSILLQAAPQSISISINSPGELQTGQTKSQDLGITPEQLQAIPGYPSYYYEGAYTLTFSAKNALVNYPSYYDVKLSFGSQELCEWSGVGTIQWQQITISCPISNYIVIDKALPSTGPVQGKSNLVVTWTGGEDGWPYWPILIDKASLTFTPQE